MRKLSSFIGLAAAVVGCGGVSGPPEPKMIPGGGIADGKVDGSLFVYVIDEETRAVMSSASVRVGDSSDPTPCEGLTDSTGLARFQSVQTHPDARGRGLAGTLVHHVSRYGFGPLGAHTLVMVADPTYLAIRVYRSVGFEVAETQLQVERR